ncbi:MAG: hypothetical protein WC785_02550 [Tatlockia sp.]|jgi:hypothetical protein
MRSLTELLKLKEVVSLEWFDIFMEEAGLWKLRQIVSPPELTKQAIEALPIYYTHTLLEAACLNLTTTSNLSPCLFRILVASKPGYS